MMKIVEGPVNLTPIQESFIYYVLSYDFPWYYQRALYGTMQFSHCLMRRNDQYLPIPGRIESQDYRAAELIFKSFCESHNIIVNNVLRAAINCTFHSQNKNIGIHRDHEFDHNVFLMYLNDSSGDTIIYHGEKENRIPFEKYKAVVFSGEEHSHEFCSVDERRVVMAFTFN